MKILIAHDTGVVEYDPNELGVAVVLESVEDHANLRALLDSENTVFYVYPNGDDRTCGLLEQHVEKMKEAQ